MEAASKLLLAGEGILGEQLHCNGYGPAFCPCKVLLMFSKYEQASTG